VVLGAFEAANSTIERLIKGLSLLMFMLAAMLMFEVVVGLNQTANTNTSESYSAQASNQTNNSIFTTVKTKAELNNLLNNAKTQEKLVMVDVYADWCIECKIMASTLFADGEVQKQLSNFESIKLDITEFNDFHKNYLESNGIFGPPALLFYGLDGVIIKEAQILGEISKQDFLEHLQQFNY